MVEQNLERMVVIAICSRLVALWMLLHRWVTGLPVEISQMPEIPEEGEEEGSWDSMVWVRMGRREGAAVLNARDRWWAAWKGLTL